MLTVIYILFVCRLRSASLEVVRLLIASNAHVNHSYKKKPPYTSLTPTSATATASTTLTSASIESQTISGSPLPTLTLAAVTPLCYVLEQAALAAYSTSELIAQHQRYIHKHHSHLTSTHTYTNTSSENKPPSNSLTLTPTPYTHGISQLSPVENASFLLCSSQLQGSNTLASYAMVHDNKAITQPSSARKTWVSVLALLLDAGMYTCLCVK